MEKLNPHERGFIANSIHFPNPSTTPGLNGAIINNHTYIITYPQCTLRSTGNISVDDEEDQGSIDL